MSTTLEAVRAEALFVSAVQSSERPDPQEVRRAVTATLRRYRIRGCALRVASEFGDHPDTAAARMTWALAMIRATYPPQPRRVADPGPVARPHRLAG
jgi:hypothetical protein